MSCSKEADGKDLWDPLGMGPERKEDCSGERKGRMQWDFCFRAGKWGGTAGYGAAEGGKNVHSIYLVPRQE